MVQTFPHPTTTIVPAPALPDGEQTAGFRVAPLAYLVSRYPSVSHTFVLREVESLRRLGFRIETASINSPDRPADQLTDVERRAVASTFVVKQAGIAGLVCAHLWMLLRQPIAYARTLGSAFRLGGFHLPRLLYRLFYFAEAILLAHWMQRNRLRHLHVHFATEAATVGLLAAKGFGFSYSLTMHGPDEFYEVSEYHLREKIAAARFVCLIGSYARSQAMRLSASEHWSKLEVAPLGVDPDEFRPAPFRDRPNPFVVLCVGRLVAAKGQAILIEAVNALVERGHAVELRLVGDGPERSALERQVRERRLERQVLFLGACNQDRVRELLPDCDAFALASFAEGIPVALMEAMATEIACVSTRITGIPELIRDGIDGLLVAPSDIAGLAAALENILLNPQIRRELGAAGRRRVESFYNLPVNVAHLARIYEARLAPEGQVGS